MSEWFSSVKTEAVFVVYSESPASESEGAQSSPVKNKHSEDDPTEAEGREVKRLKSDKEGEARDAPNQTASSEGSSGMGEETETSSTSQDKDKDTTCATQHCTEEEEEGISGFFSFNYLCTFSKELGFSVLEAGAVGIAECPKLCIKVNCLFILQFHIVQQFFYFFFFSSVVHLYWKTYGS